MSYSDIDPILKSWAKPKKLHIFTEYQDSEVRTIEIVRYDGKSYQLWIDVPIHEKVEVHIWDFKKQRKDFKVDIDGLLDALDNAYNTMLAWD